MIDPKDEDWLRKLLKDCFDNTPTDNKKLKSFRIIVENFVKNLESKVNETRILWETKPRSKKLRNKLYSLEKNLFYLRRFCAQGNLKAKR